MTRPLTHIKSLMVSLYIWLRESKHKKHPLLMQVEQLLLELVLLLVELEQLVQLQDQTHLLPWEVWAEWEAWEASAACLLAEWAAFPEEWVVWEAWAECHLI